MRFSGGLILLAAVAAVFAQGNVTISTGDLDRPVVQESPHEILMISGRATFEIDTTKVRAFQFGGLAGSAEITCDERPVKKRSWYRIERTITCSVEASERSKVRLSVLNEPATKVARLKPVDKLDGWEVKVGSDPLIAVVDLSFRSAKPAAVQPTAPTKPSPSTPPIQEHQDSPQSSLLRLAVIAFAVVALGVLGMLLFALIRRFIAVRRKPIETGKALEPVTPTVAEALVNDRLRAFAADLTKLQKEIREIGTQQQEVLSSRLAQLAGQQDLVALRETLQRNLTETQDEIAALGSAQARSFNRLREELDAVNRELTDQKRTIAQLNSGPSENLMALMRIVPQDHLSAAAGQDTARLLDRAVADFFCQSVPSRDGLKQSSERAKAFARTIENLLNDIAPDFPDSGERLKPLLDQARQIQAEIEGLLTAATNRMRLRFDVEFYASKANRERLIDGIAVGLKNQIVKLEKPIEYFDRQLLALTASAAQTATDFLDANVDPQRNNARVQELLQEVLGAGGLEQIAPSPNEEFRASEHAVVQVMPRPGGPGRAPCVAKLVARGFRRSNETIRKASVILYE